MRTFILSLVFTFLCITNIAKAQAPSISIDDYLETTGEVVIPIYINNFSNAQGVTLMIQYNGDALDYLGFQNLNYTPTIWDINNTLLDETENTYTVNIAWLSLTSQNINGVFVELIFMFNGGSSDFTVTFEALEDASWEPIPGVNVSNGSITYQEPVEVALAEMPNAIPGEVEVPLFVDFSNVEAGVGTFDFLIEYDHNVLSDPGISNQELTGIAFFTPETGKIRLQWENPDPTGSQFEGQLLTLNFQLTEGGMSDLSFIADSGSIANQDGINLPVHFIDGYIEVAELYDVTFVVKDGLDGEVTNATVVLGTLENPPGNYTFTDVYAGTYSYTVTAPGFSETTGTLVLDQDLNVTVTIDDVEAPQIECPADILNIAAIEGGCYAIITNIGEPVVSDNHTPEEELEVTNNAPGDDRYLVGTTFVVWTVTDAAGNVATCTQTITVVDNEPPQVTCPSDLLEVTTDEGVCYATITELGMPEVSDNCTPGVELTIENNAPVDNHYPVGTTLVVWTVTDAAGNVATCTQTITVVDNEPPQITCPPDILDVASDEGVCYATITDLGMPEVSDNCTPVGELEIVNNAPADDRYLVGTTLVVWTVTDAAGNTATCTQTITVVDIEEPVISDMPNDIITNNDPGQCDAEVTWILPTAADNCGVVSFTSTHQPGDFFNVGETTVSYTAIDAAGNESTESFVITVEDTEPPVISNMPENITVAADPEASGATVTWTLPTADDNCEVVSFTGTHQPGDFFNVGETTVSYTAIDAAGNETTESFTVTVEDTDAPVPPTETLQDITVFDGDIVCFNATQTIITAGNNTYFIVEGGGSATLIAGESIRLLPGTVVKHGGYLHARITLDDEYCGAPIATLLDEPADVPLAEQFVPENPDKRDPMFKVFPNPTTGAFTLELTDVFTNQPVTVEVYGLRGERILTEVITHAQQHHFSLENRLPGIYIIRVTVGDQTDHQRLIKR